MTHGILNATDEVYQVRKAIHGAGYGTQTSKCIMLQIMHYMVKVFYGHNINDRTVQGTTQK